MTVKLKVYPDERPKTRGECADMPRPCPFLSCKWHLAHEWMTKKGHRMSDDEAVSAILDSDETCALDVADRGPHERKGLAEVTRQHINMVDVIVGKASKRSRGNSELHLDVVESLARHSEMEQDPARTIAMHSKNRSIGSRDGDRFG